MRTSTTSATAEDSRAEVPGQAGSDDHLRLREDLQAGAGAEPERPDREVRLPTGRRARVRLRQRAEVIVRVKRGKNVVRNLGRGCFRGRKTLRFRWGGQIKRPTLRPAPPGRYRLQVLVLSDRKTFSRSRVVRIR